MKSKSHIFTIGAILFGAGIFLSHHLTKTMLKIAIEREGAQRLNHAPTLQKRISGYLPKEDFRAAIHRAESKLRALPLQRIEIKAKDGTALVGHWYPCEKQERIIIAMHGWRSDWAHDFGMIAPFLNQNHCSVLYAEQRGQGESGGDYMGFGLTERLDCLSWIQWVNNQIGRAPLYLAGISMGAATVLMAAGLGLPDNVKGIIADCGFTSPHAIWKHIAENHFHLSFRLRGPIADHFCKKALKIGANAYSTRDALLKSTTPILLIHGKEDHFVPLEMTLENYHTCTAPKRLLIIPGADHGMSYYSATERYQKKVLEFFAAFDHFQSY